MSQILIVFLTRQNFHFKLKVSVKGFLDGRGCGTDNWTAPEIVRKRQSPYFFQLNTNYNCKRCFKAKSADQGSARGSSGRRNRQFTGDFQRADVCTKCRAKIFEFYRKNDIYSTGLVLWSILKAGIFLVLLKTIRFDVIFSSGKFHWFSYRK